MGFPDSCVLLMTVLILSLTSRPAPAPATAHAQQPPAAAQLWDAVAPMPVFFSSRRRHTRYWRDWSSDVCSSDLHPAIQKGCHAIEPLRVLKLGAIEQEGRPLILSREIVPCEGIHMSGVRHRPLLFSIVEQEDHAACGLVRYRRGCERANLDPVPPLTLLSSCRSSLA